MDILGCNSFDGGMQRHFKGSGGVEWGSVLRYLSWGIGGMRGMYPSNFLPFPSSPHCPSPSLWSLTRSLLCGTAAVDARYHIYLFFFTFYNHLFALDLLKATHVSRSLFWIKLFLIEAFKWRSMQFNFSFGVFMDIVPDAGCTTGHEP